jgi:hypothetical protein
MTKWLDLKILEAVPFVGLQVIGSLHHCIGLRLPVSVAGTRHCCVLFLDGNAAQTKCIRYIVNIRDIWHSIIQHPKDFPKPVITPINAVPVVAAEFLTS